MDVVASLRRAGKLCPTLGTVVVLAACVSALSTAPPGAVGLGGEETEHEESVEAPGVAAEPDPDWAALAAARLPLLEPCELPNAPERVLCGSIEVWENRAARSGRRIPLEIVVIPARNENPPPDAVFVFEGGPGGAATGRALGSIYAGPVRQRDIVLVDQRGTGGSNPLECAWEEDFRDGELREIFPADRVTRCAAELERRAEIELYTSEHFADDIEEVRKRLGYGSINIRGGSYGTAAMMTFAQRHPESTRSLLGIGANSPLRSNLAERWRWPRRTLDRLSELCAAEPECAAVAPDLAAMVTELIARLDREAPRVEMPDPTRPDQNLAFTLDRDWLVEELRLILYFAFSSRGLPWAVHRAHEAGDWAPLATMAVLIERMFRGSLAHGMVLTVQCSEAMDFDHGAALARGAGTLFGNYRLEQQIQGCDVWPHRRKPPLGVAEPRPLAIPTLLFSGALDPVTPPEYAEEVATYFPLSRHIVLAEGQHGPFDLANSWECFHRIWADFLDHGLDDLDTSCTASMTRPPFVVDAPGFATFLDETLVPAAG